MLVRIDENGEAASDHIRNALQILSLAERIVNDTRFPQRNGMVRLTPAEAAGLKSRLHRALRLLET